MKNFITILLLAALMSTLTAAVGFQKTPVSPRSVKLGKTMIPMMTKGKVVFQLYVPANASWHIKERADKFAAYLSILTGTKIKPVSKLPAASGTTVLRFGDGDFARSLRIALTRLDRDGFVIAASGRNILLAGSDALFPDRGEGTFYAALDFMERFAGARFYFPGKHGTILPRKKDWQVPSMTVYDRPDAQYRQIWWGSTKWYDSARSYNQTLTDHTRELRFSSMNVPNGHSLACFGYIKRFAKTHPEYFATRIDGSRADGIIVRDPSDVHGHLCFSSGIMEEIYQDAKAILTGPAAIKKRNMSGARMWMVNTKPFFHMMPNDSMIRCRCKKCAPYHVGLGNDSASGYSKKAADFTWEKQLSIPNRLKKEKIPGIVTMMAYDLTRQVPEQTIPDNVLLQVAAFGPWGEMNKAKQQQDEMLLQRWNKKLNSKTYMWNYTTKASVRGVYHVPNFTPKTIGQYYKKVNKYIFGAFLESETDYWLFSHLNNYVFCKLMWDNNTDVDALLDEYRKVMFGSGAAPMKEFMDALENHWMKDIVNNVEETSLGPVVRPPSEHKIWTQIYSPAEVKRINGLFDKAEKLAAREKDALERIRFIRKNLWGPLNDAAATYFKNANAIQYWQADAGALKAGEKITIDGSGNEKAWDDAPAITLLPLKKDEAEVLTVVKMLFDKENLYFLFDCEEPFTDKMPGKKRAFDDPDMWEDNSVEIHLDPAGTKQHNYQFMIDRFGSICDRRITNKPLKHDLKWNSGAKAATTLIPGKKWIAEISIPRKSMPQDANGMIVANFNRHRVTDGVRVHKYYTWSPYVKSFGDQRNFGYIHLGVRKSKNLFSDGDLANSGIKWSKKSKWAYSGVMPQRDTKCFRTAGVSLRLEGHRSGMIHTVSGLKPDTTYRLSFFIRQKDVKLHKGVRPGDGTGFFVRVDDGNNVVRNFPRRAFYGSIPWTRWEYIYRTSSKKPGTSYTPYIHFVLRHTSGQVWVDKPELVEIPDPKKSSK